MGIIISVFLGLIIYLIIFISIDEMNKRNNKIKSLQHEKSWIDYKRTLPKYVP